ncbi:hypothetical protein B0T16DRAFT_151071 [Cercophora newfieldiana]|uniref:Uncharacterized protein n=1 Tax=Cercophora newfieldiana TaxID=92897 RepID=A0AA40CPA3_9PEZI|nr:hypothetical protein B0T16DRAFT_151071 [Cercophora newfieldiana]
MGWNLFCAWLQQVARFHCNVLVADQIPAEAMMFRAAVTRGASLCFRASVLDYLGRVLLGKRSRGKFVDPMALWPRKEQVGILCQIKRQARKDQIPILMFLPRSWANSGFWLGTPFFPFLLLHILGNSRRRHNSATSLCAVLLEFFEVDARKGAQLPGSKLKLARFNDPVTPTFCSSWRDTRERPTHPRQPALSLLRIQATS